MINIHSNSKHNLESRDFVSTQTSRINAQTLEHEKQPVQLLRCYLIFTYKSWVVLKVKKKKWYHRTKLHQLTLECRLVKQECSGETASVWTRGTTTHLAQQVNASTPLHYCAFSPSLHPSFISCSVIQTVHTNVLGGWVVIVGRWKGEVLQLLLEEVHLCEWNM